MSAFNTDAMRGVVSQGGGGMVDVVGEGVHSARDVAGLLGVSVSTVWRWAADGVIPRPIRIGGARRWTDGDLRELIDRAKAARDGA